MLEKATERRANASRHIKVPGKPRQFANTDPVKIARELRAKSALGKLEARLDDSSGR